MCHNGQTNPLDLVRAQEGHAGLVYRAGGNASVQYPLVMHASGLHSRLSKVPGRHVANRTAAEGGEWTPNVLDVMAAPDLAAFMRHPVLLLDSAAHGLCNATTIGQWLAHGRQHGVG